MKKLFFLAFVFLVLSFGGLVLACEQQVVVTNQNFSEESFLTQVKEKTFVKLSHHVEEMSNDDAQRLSRVLIEEERLDSLLLSRYSDWLSSSSEPLAHNTQRYAHEKLFFFNNTVEMYTALEHRGSIVVGLSRDNQLIIKDGANIKEVNLSITNCPFIRRTPVVNNHATRCIAEYNKKYALINCATLEKLILSDATVACCFYTVDKLCGVDQTGQVLIFDIDMQRWHLVTKLNFGGVPVRQGTLHCAIANDLRGDHIVVSALSQLFIITRNSSTYYSVETINMDHITCDTIYDGSGIQKLFINETGTHLCIVSGYNRVYLCDLRAQDRKITNVTERLLKNITLQDNEYIRIKDVDIRWSLDGTLLIVKGEYEHSFGSSCQWDPAGTRYSFIVLDSGNSWTEKNARPSSSLYGERYLTSSHDGSSAITKDFSAWGLFTSTEKFTIYDSVMLDALHYLTITKKHEKSKKQRLLGMSLLYSIVEQQKSIICLDKTESAIYNNDLSDEVKTILTKIYSIKKFEDSVVSFLGRLLKNSLYNACCVVKKNIYRYRQQLTLSSLLVCLVAYKYLASR